MASRTRTPKQARSRETARVIALATLKVLASEGVAGVTTTRVAEVAGVGIGTLYAIFPSRESLLRAAEELSWSEQVERLAQLVVDHEDKPLEESIVAIVSWAIDYFVARHRLHGITAEDLEALPQRLALVDGVVGMLDARLEARKDRLFPGDRRLALAMVVKLVAAMSWLGLRDHPEQIADRSYHALVARMVTRFLVSDA